MPLGAATRRAHVGPQLCAALTNFRPVITVRVVPAVPPRRCHIACGRYQGTGHHRTKDDGTYAYQAVEAIRPAGSRQMLVPPRSPSITFVVPKRHRDGGHGGGGRFGWLKVI